jgi:hypothetical protein
MMCRSVGAQNARAAALVDRQLSVDPKQVVWPRLSWLDCQEASRVSRGRTTLRDILLAT